MKVKNNLESLYTKQEARDSGVRKTLKGNVTVRGLDLDITGLCLQFFTPENMERVLPSLIKAIRLSNDLLNPNEKRVLNSMVARLMFLAEQNAEADNQIEKLEQQYLVENP